MIVQAFQPKMQPEPANRAGRVSAFAMVRFTRRSRDAFDRRQPWSTSTLRKSLVYINLPSTVFCCLPLLTLNLHLLASPSPFLTSLHLTSPHLTSPYLSRSPLLSHSPHLFAPLHATSHSPHLLSHSLFPTSFRSSPQLLHPVFTMLSMFSKSQLYVHCVYI